MPIPQNGPLSLLGHSRPGETAQSNPKHAMIVRMSAETLEALESFPNHPSLEFLLSDHPGIFIGETFFPMLPVKEEQTHEIYLRTSSAGKKSTSLKLYANVVGKFNVERQLGDRLTDKIRESTLDAANQRNNRTTILIDTPPPMPTKKRKDPSHSNNMFRKAVRTSHNTTAGSSSAAVNFSSIAKELRQRMIRCIAAKERTVEDIIKSVGGSNCGASTKRDIMDCLAEIAELKDKTSKHYTLKPESWREVRPYEWPNLNTSDRTRMVSAARAALKSVGIPENDPVWNQFNSRNHSGVSSGSQQTTTSTTSNRVAVSTASEAPKRGIISSKDVREKKARVKSNTKAEIMMKDEGARAIQSNQAKSGAKESVEVNTDRSTIGSTSQKNTPLRKPGSGFRATKTVPNEASSSSSSKPSDNRIRKDSDSHVYSKPTGGSSVVNNSTDRRGNAGTNIQKIKKLRDEDYSYGVDSDREKRRDRDWGRERIKDQPRHQEREEGEHSEDDSLPTKRKKALIEDNLKANTQKRRKIDHSLAASNTQLSTPKDLKVRDAAIPKRPETAQHQKSRPFKEQSLLPPVPKIVNDSSPPLRPTVAATGKISSASTSSSSAQNFTKRTESLASTKGHKVNGTAKVRRKSPIYTSSEDEGEIPSSRPVRREARDAVNAENAISSEKPVNGSHSLNLNNASRALRSLPMDRSSLRAKYRKTYGVYMKIYQRIVDQKSKLDSMLESSVADSLTDSDGDVELLDPDALKRLTMEHQKLYDELETIRQMHSKLTNGSSPSE